MSHALKYLFFMTILLTSFSCVGNNDYAGGGIGGTGITGVSVGKVTAIDLTNSSISVNGVSFSLTDAGITVDGITADVAKLKIGMIVRVDGEFDTSGLTGKALTIEFENNIEGPVDTGSIDPLTKSFKVLGNTIFVDTTTVFEGTASFDSLKDGNVVEVSGFEDADGSIHATYIELKEETFQQGTTHVELKGPIISVDKGTKTFVLNNITINYGDVNIDDSILTVGINIEVKGVIVINNNIILVAIKVELHDTKPTVKEGEKVEIEGYITEITSSTDKTVDFKVNNQQVHVDTSYSKIKGGDISVIQEGIKIEVKGTIESGILNATKISIETEEEEEDDDESDKKLNAVSETNKDSVNADDSDTISDSQINNSTDDQNVSGQDSSQDSTDDEQEEADTVEDDSIEGNDSNDTVDSDNIEEEKISQSDTEDEHQDVDEIETEQKDEEDK